MRSLLQANWLTPEKPAFHLGSQICWQAVCFGCIHAFNIAWPDSSSQPCTDSSTESFYLINGLQGQRQCASSPCVLTPSRVALTVPAHGIGGVTWPKKR